MKRKSMIRFAQHGGTARVIAYLLLNFTPTRILLRVWMAALAILVAAGMLLYLPATLYGKGQAQFGEATMSIGASVGQVLGMMKEFIRPNLPKLYMNDSKLFHKIGGPREGMPKVSSGANARPYRVPMELLAGFKGFTSSPDGAALQRGSGPTTDAGTLVPVYVYQAAEWTKATEINTNSDKKSIENYATLVAERQTKQFNKLMESLIQGDGSFTLDTVVSTGVNVLNVNNANQFYDNQDIDCWSALSGNFLGTVTVQTADGPNKQLNLTGPVPAGVGAGTLLLLNGAAGVANSGLFGIKYFQVASNTGSVMNLLRTAYPGRLSTPHVSAAGNALTPAIGQRIEGQMIAAMGVDYAEDAELLVHWGTDMAAAWENVAQNVSTVVYNQVKGDSQPDMLKAKRPKTFMGHETLRSANAAPARIDLLHLESWFKIENQPIDFYEVSGQTEFPVQGGNGVPIQSTASWLWNGVQFGNENVRAGAYADGFTAPAGF
jgi:hypothetical protein